MSIKHCLVQLWQPFPYIFVDADVVNAQCAKWGSTLPKTSSRVTVCAKKRDLKTQPARAINRFGSPKG